MATDESSLVGRFIDAVGTNAPEAEALLAEHPEVLEGRWLHGETPLHFLAVEGYLAGVEWLVSRGANINATNEFGDTALCDAATVRNLPLIELLLRFGADPNLSRTTPLFTAIQSGDIELVEILLKAGARTAAGEYSVELALALCPQNRSEIVALTSGYEPGFTNE